MELLFAVILFEFTVKFSKNNWPPSMVLKPSQLSVPFIVIESSLIPVFPEMISLSIPLVD